MQPFLFVTWLLVAVPCLVFLLWMVVSGLEAIIPGCDVGMVGIREKACPVAGVDVGMVLVLLVAPFISAFFAVPYAVFCVCWLMVVALRAGLWLLFRV